MRAVGSRCTRRTAIVGRLQIVIGGVWAWLLLSHDPTLATIGWLGGSSNNSQRPEQHGRAGAFAAAFA